MAKRQSLLLKPWQQWYVSHARALTQALGNLYKNKLASSLTILVIAVALALPTLFYALLNQFESIGSDFGLEGKVSLYLKLDTGEQAGRELAQQLSTRADIKTSVYISREESYAFFAKHSSFASALQELGENPLPAVIEVVPIAASSDLGDVAQNATHLDLRAPIGSEQFIHLQRELSKLPYVDKVRVDLQWLQRLGALSRSIQSALNVLAILLALAVVLAVGNTIRLDVKNNARAIHIQKLIGATNSFIRRPFLYTGLCYGVAGGLCAWLMVNLALALLRPNVASVAKLYASDYNLALLQWSDAVILIFISSAMGMAGAWLALIRHLEDQYGTF